ncbi:ATP-dependent DNA helicase [Corticibacter populi]|uniref:DNA 5'-3' helicase n=1 Tax=Corticibacter populi TaxID=1550736 RepID=A0A3M6QYV3_9BURK|nr:ATP-dependent DNA helicase [Corticibacter populi]RMX08073.1 ATP-dependent DNA helicase [Corticibacter populi]
MQFSEHIAATFGTHGALAEVNPDFKPRSGQSEMAQAVAETIEQGGALVVEAGTGVGKTYAYLIPALLSGERVLVSTATKALQDQIFFRDLPFLRKALGISLHAALLKGRSSYLCPYRLELAESELDGARPEQIHWLQQVRRWAATTQSGDMSEMPNFQERSPHLPLVTSTRENCLGSQCPSFGQCHVNKARKQALAADLVVINHHLFFADLQVRESGMAELLPSTRAVIIDEAHQFNETGVQFLGVQWGSQPLIDFARDMLRTATALARGMQDWQPLAHAIDTACRDWLRLMPQTLAQPRLNWAGRAPESINEAAWLQALDALGAVLDSALQALQSVQEMAPELARLTERCADMLEKCRLFQGLADAPRVRWLELGSLSMRIFESPLDIAAEMRARWQLAPPEPPSEAAQQQAWLDSHAELVSPANAGTAAPPERQHAWVFTSATLGSDAGLSLFTHACGLEGARILRVPSPFDYPRQAALYVPEDLPDPREAEAHGLAVARLAGAAAQTLGGRTLVLTTTLKALRLIGGTLREQFGGAESGGSNSDGVQVLVQGERSKQQLMEWFRAPPAGVKGYVLVASATFWEGFDVPGDALELVVIDKLPFPPPNDPVVQARARRIEETGGSPFRELFLPEAAVALKQGAGRLIRRESDHGLLVLGDRRLVQKSYGRQLLASLPPMRRLQDRAQFDAALQELAVQRVPRPA